MSAGHAGYFIPEPSRWPVITMLGVLCTLMGTAFTINGIGLGMPIMLLGLALIVYIFFGWFSDVVAENLAGSYNGQVDRSFRMGMIWFIASEVFFFITFFGSLYYLRDIALPWLGGEGYLGSSKEFMHQAFTAAWPSNGPGDLGGEFKPMGAWGIPALNTAILLSSGATLTWAHWGLKKGSNSQLVWGLVMTVALGLIFVGFQAYEYIHAYQDLNLKLTTGVYGSTFFLLTGFHGFHVCVGAIMLIAVLVRSIKKHFSPHNHFAFEAVAWYWHFVDVVWLGLFIFVYWM